MNKHDEQLLKAAAATQARLRLYDEISMQLQKCNSKAWADKEAYRRMKQYPKFRHWRDFFSAVESGEGVITMTEEQEIKAGFALARILRLRHDPEFPKSRWQTSWGSKTDLGLWRTIARAVDEAREGKELEP